MDRAARYRGTVPKNEEPNPAPPAPAAPAAPEAGFLSRFPEAVDAARATDDAGAPPLGRAGLAYRILLYAGMAVGVVAALALIASVVLQALLAGSYIQAGGDYFGSGIDGRAARELLGVPLGGFIAAVVLSLAAICIGALGVFRAKAQPVQRSERDQTA